MISNIHHGMESLLCESASAPTLSVTLIETKGKELIGAIGPVELPWLITWERVLDLRDLAWELPVFVVLLWPRGRKKCY